MWLIQVEKIMKTIYRKLWKIMFISVVWMSTGVQNLCGQSLAWEEFVERMMVDEESEQTSWENL